MRLTQEGIQSSPSDLCRFMESRFATWMDRLYLDRPNDLTPDETPEDVQIIFDMGAEHEATYLKQLRSEGKDVAEIAPGGDRLAATQAAMRAGREVIYQAALAHGSFAGIADFLVRVPGASDLGDFHYEVWDTKLARRAKPYFIVQLCCYAEMLEAIQGMRPERLRVVLGTGEQHVFRTDDYIYYYRSLKRAYRAYLERFDPDQQPEPDPGADHGRWTSHAEAYLEQHDHLLRVARITKGQVAKLRAAGITTLTELAQTELPRVRGIQDPTFERLRTQARLQKESEDLDRPRFELVPPDPERPRRGLALLPPPSPGDIFFDIEGYPLVEEGLEYLLGATYLDANEPKFIDWWAHDEAQERVAFEGFVDWAYARWQQDRSMHIYHYAPYEVTALRRLMGKYGTREEEVDQLLRHEVFVDLYAVVRQGVYVGEPAYSLKNLEHLYREAREGDVTTAAGSIVYYRRWLDSQEPQDWQNSPILGEIRDYNRDDCDSLVLLAQWLRERQQEAGISYAPPEGDREPEEPALSERIQERRALAEMLLDRAQGDTPDELLGQIVEFHRREAKPAWWAMFDRQLRTEDELFDDLDCLARLRRTAEPPEQVKRSWLFGYSFDPDQDTKFAEGDNGIIAHNLIGPVTLERLERDRGHAVLKVSRALQKLGGEMPRRLSLIPGGPISAKVIEESIDRLVTAWRSRGELPQALGDLFGRRPPRIRGHDGGPLRHEGEDAVAAAIRLVSAMDGTTLCIQGPPGSGKTYTAARVILHLLDQGHTVGITSNSHKAILNLMGSCAEAHGQTVPCVKAGGDGEDPFFENNLAAVHCSSRDAVPLVDSVRLVGGTAWFFSREDMAGKLDYLFVDEAGQVSLGNLVGMAAATRNIVLLGDQMQLGQPIQGAHPGDSGRSILDYLLEERATIPDEMGLFLAQTYRLHPSLCRFISGAVYENRLASAPVCASRVVHVPDNPGPVSVEAGLLFVPVEHEGNTQGSDEEVQAITELFDHLVGRTRTDGKGDPAGALAPNDILVVAPYNMQVRKLQRALPDGSRVGSVDKFQGQQAPVVILSMCASDASAHPRGMDFLFNRNRLNVALSRAQSLAIVVGHPALAQTPCATLPNMELVNLYCRILEESAS